MGRDILTAERLRSILSYDPETGIFTWKHKSRNTWPGKVAGCKNKALGYIIIGIDGTEHYAHRLAWLYVYGTWPGGVIDHRDTDRSNNRIANLRDTSRSVNQQNIRKPRAHGTSGFLGVTWHKQTGRWKAQISVKGRNRHLGLFDDPVEAHQAYLEAKREHHSGCTI